MASHLVAKGDDRNEAEPAAEAIEPVPRWTPPPTETVPAPEWTLGVFGGGGEGAERGIMKMYEVRVTDTFSICA